jgi:hypothetical protein
MYACVIKNSSNTWDIYAFAGYAVNAEKQARLEAAVASGLPITPMILTPYKWSGTPGAIWDGEKFTGGSKSVISEDVDWNSIETYGYLCDNVIVYATVVQKDVGSATIEKMNAIFAGDSEVKIIEIPEGQTAKKGDIWDGEKVISV